MNDAGVVRMCRKMIRVYLEDGCYPFMAEDWFEEICLLAEYDPKLIKQKINFIYGDIYNE
jgi:hypothetical protein